MIKKILIILILLTTFSYGLGVGSLNFVVANSDCISTGTMGNWGSGVDKTISYWLKTVTTATSSNNQYYLGFFNTANTSAMQFSINDNSTLDTQRFWMRNNIGTIQDTVITSLDLNNGIWHFVCIPMSTSTGGNIYVDGVSKATLTNVIVNENLGFPMTIGCRNNRGTLDLYHKNTTLADIRFYTKKLFLSECEMARKCRNFPADNLQARYLFDDLNYIDSGSGANDGSAVCAGCAAPDANTDSPPTSWCTGGM
jgi:hypothetical protein